MTSFASNENDNTTVYDNFLYIIDLAIESGNTSIIQQAIKDYKDIPEIYINMAKTIYLQLITEQIEEITLT
jgi:hypothetical protein